MDCQFLDKTKKEKIQENKMLVRLVANIKGSNFSTFFCPIFHCVVMQLNEK